MKKQIQIVILLLLITSYIFAADFSPTMLKISADPIITYYFGGTELNLPVTVIGTPCQLIFSVFTRDIADTIVDIHNGYLGWHYLNRIDTCIYYSSPFQFEPGYNEVVWDGRDQDGNHVYSGTYTYYLWAYDNRSPKLSMSEYLESGKGFDYRTEIQSVDESGLPMANPIWYGPDSRWEIGGDPTDETLIETTNITLAEGWKHRGDPKMDPEDFNYFYLSVQNTGERQASIQKLKWVPNGEAEIQTDWGEKNGYAAMYSTAAGGSPGICTDGTYLYTGDENHMSSDDPDADFYIYDYDGFMVAEIDLSPWWSSEDDLEAYGQMNGGPNNFTEKRGYVFLNSHTSCLIQMVDPVAYLESWNPYDFFKWSNGNGDYVLDKNFEETAILPWVCNDYSIWPYKYSVSADDNLFSAYSAYGVGSMSFGLLAPDGTGLGYFAFANETEEVKNGLIFIDSHTPFDGLYCDNEIHSLTLHNGLPDIKNRNSIYFLGHDSVKGIIVFPVDCFGKPYVKVRSPKEGDRFIHGEQTIIAWNECSTKDARIEFSSDCGGTWVNIVDRVVKYKFYYWTVPSVTSDSCMVRVSDIDDPGLNAMSGMFSIVSDDVGVQTKNPFAFNLSQNRPNPFNPITTIPFTLVNKSHVTLTIYNIAGGKVAELSDNVFPAGKHSVEWDASGFSSGVYFYRVKAGEYEDTRRMTLLK